MLRRKVQRKVVNQKGKSRGRPLHAKGWSLHNHGLKLLISLFLIAATLFAFEQVRHHAFLNLDDNVYVTENLQVQSGLTFKSVTWAFTTMHASYWIPLTWLSLMLDCQLYGLNPGGYHLTNLVFHLANTLLLFLVLKRMTGALWKSSFVAALFALHPLHVESVAWVTERKDVLSTFFWILTMLMYVRYVERPGLNRYLLVLLSFTLGLLSKPMLVTLPFVLLLLDYWPLGRFQFGQLDKNLKSPNFKPTHPSNQNSTALCLIREKTPFFALTVVSSILAIIVAQTEITVGTLETHWVGMRFANALVSYVSYIGKMIWPSHLAVFYPYPDTFPIWKVAGSGLLLVCLSILIIRAANKRPYLMVSWLWYLGTLVPVIGLVQVGSQAMADRFTYVPLIGLFIMIAWGVPNILAGWRYSRVVLSMSAGLLLSILMIVTRLQVRHWQNDITLFQHSVNVTANNYLSHTNLGVALFHQGKIEEAIAHYAEALRIKSDRVETYNCLGVALAHQGRYQEAITHFKEALRIKPDDAVAHNNLGLALERLGKDEEAIAHYVEAFRIKPDYVEAHNNLGAFLLRRGKYHQAIAHFTEALRLNPHYAEAHINLGLAYLMIGNRSSAMEEYKILKKINPDMADILYSRIPK